MRKLVAIFLALLVVGVFIARLHLGLGIQWRLRQWAKGPLQTVEEVETKAKTWVDKTPPTAPKSLGGGQTPTIKAEQSYILKPYLGQHSTVAFDSSGGDLIVMAASTHNGAMLTPSDNYHNTWTSLAGPTDAKSESNVRSQVWYAKNPTVGPGHIITVDLSRPESLVISAIVVQGADTSSPIDASSPLDDDGGTQSPVVASSVVQTTSPDDLLIGFGKSAFSEVWLADNGFTFQPDASSDFLVAESGLAIAPGSYATSFKIDTPSTWESAIVAVRPAVIRPKPAQISLEWHASTDNVGVAGYRVERCQGKGCTDFSPIGSSKSTSYVDSGLGSSAIYRYRVRAVDLAGNMGEYSQTFEAKTDSN